MEQDEFTLEYFCRLCAAEAALGVMLHPLFPPGDDDPKDELVRMIDVLTSVTLTRTQDSSAVVCDKCLQMLDLFCQFREECLRQDVMIRTRRELEKERRQEEAAAAAAASAVCVEIKEEPEPEEPPTIVIDDCKDEPPEEDEDEEDDEEVQPCANQVAQQLLASSLVTNNSSSNSSSSFMTPAEISLYSQTSSLSISVQVNQISLDNMGTAALVAVPVLQTIPDQTQIPPQTIPAPPPPTTSTPSSTNTTNTTFRKGKLDPNKPPPDCELCQESFATHYDYEQHLDQVHAWDRGTRCSLACDPCQMRFTKSYNLKRHMYEVHGELAPGLTVSACEYCGLKFLRGYTLNRHVAKMHSKRAKAKKMMILKSK